MVPHLIVFSERGLQGRHWHIFHDIADIGSISLTWNDNISSFVVLTGVWQFYRDRQYQSPVGGTIGPGVYPSLSDIGVPNDAISSMRLVQTVTGDA